ncbi:MAG TPA: hypothetical protein VI455_02925 [Terriglobia bacterium]
MRLVDAAHERTDESLPTVGVAAYLPSQVNREWQWVRIPLQDFEGVDPGRLIRLAVIFKRPGDYQFYLDSIGFEPSGTASQPAYPLLTESAQPAQAQPVEASRRGMWVWDAPPLLGNTAKADEFFTFCDRNRIADIYLAPSYLTAQSESPPGRSLFRIDVPEQHRAFLARAHQRGLRVEALLGDPEWAAEKNHEGAMAAVEAVLDFNRQAPSAARFDGVHLDIEPYVLVGFVDLEYRKQLLGEFLELISRCAARVRTEAGTTLTCDVPWWFYPLKSPDREGLTVAFQGQSKTVGEHLTDLLEKVP